MRTRSIWHFNLGAFLVVDYLLLAAAVLCAFVVSPSFQQQLFDGITIHRGYRLIFFGMPLAMEMGLHLVGLQRVRSGFWPSETIVLTVIGISMGMVGFVLINALVTFSLVGRYILVLSLCYGTAFIVGSRLFIWNMAKQTSRSILFFGEQDAFARLQKEISKRRLPIRLIERASMERIHEFDALQDRQVIAKYCSEAIANEVVVEQPEGLSAAERLALLACTGAGINVANLNGFYERTFERVYMPSLTESWFWSYDPTYANSIYFAFKRLTDLLLGTIGMVFLLPVAPLIAVLIKLNDGGPILYSQVRVGLYNRPFRIYKFRTMKLDAEKSGAKWASKNDPRVTAIGGLMRKTRLDETPQFWNILKGEMSFIGPRPERPEFVAQIEHEIPLFRYRHIIKPGLTGWAQINYPYGASIYDAQEKLAYDLYYLKYASVARDLLIIVQTVNAAMRGAR